MNEPSPWERTLLTLVNRFVYHLARHWVAAVNLVVALYVLPAVVAPFLMLHGVERPAKTLYFLYGFVCHQLPERSFFVGGEKLTYSLDELRDYIGEGTDNLLVRRRFIGNEQLGYKMAMCERDIALWGSILVAGIWYALLRRKPEPLSFRAFLILTLPLAVDGVTQLFGLRESTPPGRVVTGALFGIALVWTFYPRLETQVFEELRITAASNLSAQHKGPDAKMQS